MQRLQRNLENLQKKLQKIQTLVLKKLNRKIPLKKMGKNFLEMKRRKLTVEFLTLKEVSKEKK